MSADQISDEVALDFQESLQDLQNNNRYEISNLTIIAKENTEHAQAIAMVLEKHIKTVRLSKTKSRKFSLCQAEPSAFERTCD
jgi:pre-mRNA cleavage complex 2 protein Pcf11